RILRPIIRNRDVLAAIRGHHERLDGNGYPDGLCGNQISFLARMIAIPDCFDAMTTVRSYRAALPLPQALGVLSGGAGSRFDPDLVQAFVKIAASFPVGELARV